MRHGRYILIGQTPVPEPSLSKWGEWMEHGDRVVAQTEIPGGMISTVFLGLDHQFSMNPAAPPMLFETMVFLDGEGTDCERCATWLEAEMQHAATVQEWLAKLAR